MCTHARIHALTHTHTLSLSLSSVSLFRRCRATVLSLSLRYPLCCIIALRVASSGHPHTSRRPRKGEESRPQHTFSTSGGKAGRRGEREATLHSVRTLPPSLSRSLSLSRRRVQETVTDTVFPLRSRVAHVDRCSIKREGREGREG